MNSKPILFSEPMVRAILAGKKTVTRRVIAPNSLYHQDGNERCCPYLTDNGTLWVRETWARNSASYLGPAILYRADLDPETAAKIKWKPSIFMPKQFSRIIIRATNITVEQLNNMPLEDVYKEGISPDITNSQQAFDAFKALWNGINEDRGYGWTDNPPVWRVEFELLHPKGFSSNFSSNDPEKGGRNGKNRESQQQKMFV